MYGKASPPSLLLFFFRISLASFTCLFFPDEIWYHFMKLQKIIENKNFRCKAFLTNEDSFFHRLLILTLHHSLSCQSVSPGC